MIKASITLDAITPVTVLTPSRRMKNGYIQNNGDNDARLALDGGTPAGNTDPTTSKGFLLPAHTQLWLSQFYGSNMVGIPEDKAPIRAIAVTGTTSIDAGTDDPAST